MPIVRTRPSEFLVVAERGRLANRGAAASVFLMKRTAWVKVPGEQQEARFEMTQETPDGIPLRFKGSAVLRIVRPEAAAQLFDFTTGEGLAAMKMLACNACLGELRDQVSHMTMQECIEQRKTTLTGAVRAALEAETRGRIRSASDLAELSARESVELAKIAAGRGQHALQVAAEREKRAQLAEAELAGIEGDKPVQLARSRCRQGPHPQAGRAPDAL